LVNATKQRELILCELDLNNPFLHGYSRQMQEARTLAVSRISAETSASAALDEVCRWLIARQGNPVRLTVDDLPALGQDCWLRLALPISAPRAVLSAMWLVAEMDASECLLVGHLRFVAHPTKSDLRLSFNGRTAAAIRSGLLHGQADHTARQLLELIAQSIERQKTPAMSSTPTVTESVRIPMIGALIEAIPGTFQFRRHDSGAMRRGRPRWAS
jgi:hypothetical protein